MLSRIILNKGEMFEMVGDVGFEPTTLWSQTRCASQLRHTPSSLMGLQIYDDFL